MSWRHGKAAEESLLALHRPFVWRVAWRFLRNTEDARDVTQDVLLALHRRLPALPEGTNLAAWLYRVTSNRAVNLRRDRARRARRQEEAARLAPREAPAHGEATGFARDLSEAMASLPPQQRGVVTLRLIEELTFGQIASIFGVSEGTVKVQFARGMKKLKDALEAWR